MAVSGFFARSELTQALWAFRREFWITGALSMVINVLMLAPTLYMLQVFDRVMVSYSGTTLVMLSLLTLMLFVMAFLTIPALLRKKLSRGLGIVLLCIYAAFCILQFTM